MKLPKLSTITQLLKKILKYLLFLLILYVVFNIIIYFYLFTREKNHRGYKMNTLSERNSYAIGGVLMTNFFLPFMIIGTIKSFFKG